MRTSELTLDWLERRAHHLSQLSSDQVTFLVPLRIRNDLIRFVCLSLSLIKKNLSLYGQQLFSFGGCLYVEALSLRNKVTKKENPI